MTNSSLESQNPFESNNSNDFSFPPPGVQISEEYLLFISRLVKEDTKYDFGSSAKTVWSEIAPLEGNDGMLQKHSIEVAWVAQCLGKLYGMSQDQLDILGTASLLHDTGLVLLPHLANKRGKFTRREKTVANEHPERGFVALRPMEFPSPILQVIRNHHADYEKYIDCPDSERVFVEIVTIADTYAAVRDTNRVHNEDPKTNEVAREKILYLMRPRERFNPEYFAMFELFCQRINRLEKEIGDLSLQELAQQTL